ncbi:MAG: histidine phosphatase family protein [Armatimonadaceae bacterium]
MKTVYLVRHCQTTGQAPDAPLTEKGFADAVILADFLANLGIERIVSSPYTRAVQSIEPFAKRTGITLETDARVQERTLTTEPISDWMTMIRAAFNDIDLRYPGGETGREVRERALAALDDILAHPASTTVVVSHGGWSSSVLHHYTETFGFDDWQGMTNPDVYRLTFNGDRIEEIVRVWD